MSKLNSVAMSTCLWMAVLCAQMLMTRGAALKVKYCSQNDECGAGLYCDTSISMCDNCKPICDNPSRIKDCRRHCKVMYDEQYNTVQPPVQEPTPKAEHTREEPSDAENTGNSTQSLVVVCVVVGAIVAVALVIGGIVWKKHRDNACTTKPVQATEKRDLTARLAVGSEQPFLQD